MSSREVSQKPSSSSGGGGAMLAPCGDCGDKGKFIVFWICYLISGLLIFVCGCICLSYSEKAGKVDWLITTSKTTYDYYFTPHKVLHYILFIILILLALLVAVLMLLKGNVVKDNAVYEMAFSQFGKFLVIPMFLTWGMEMIPLCQQDRWEGGHAKTSDEVACKATCMIFALLCSIAYIIIYIKLNKTNKEIWSFLYKKCFISACIAYHLFMFLNSLSDLIRDDNARKKHPKNIYDDLERISYVWMILYGLGLGFMSFWFDDVVMAFYGMMFNMGFMISSARTPKRLTDWKKIPVGALLLQRITGNLVCSIIFFVAFIALIVIILVRKKKDIMD